MPDNPLNPSSAHERAVDERAQRLWEEDGRPEGRLADYRERADELVRMEMAGKVGQLPNPETHPAPVEEAFIQENLGEFPGAMNTDDQGDWRQMPMTREQVRENYDPGPNHGDHP
jgi:Protein of unknown function (DUF2934)